MFNPAFIIKIMEEQEFFFTSKRRRKIRKLDECKTGWKKWKGMDEIDEINNSRERKEQKTNKKEMYGNLIKARPCAPSIIRKEYYLLISIYVLKYGGRRKFFLGTKLTII